MIIADAGSTKTRWVHISPEGEQQELLTPGINALMATRELLEETVSVLKARFQQRMPRSVYYYGAGCVGEEARKRIADMLTSAFGTVSVEVEGDMLGAARALCGHKPGICCILGTGSASCLYDGERIVSQIPSLGYILGDEGSGAALGKRLVSDYFKGVLDPAVADLFSRESTLTYETLVNRVYREQGGNRYLASFATFLGRHLDMEGVRDLVFGEMIRFLERNVLLYPDATSLPVHFIGSVAYHFSDPLRQACASRSVRVGAIEQSPTEGLVKYHTQKNNTQPIMP